MMDYIELVFRVSQIAAIAGSLIYFAYTSGRGASGVERSIALINQAVLALKEVVMSQGDEIKEIRVEFKSINTILTQVALQSERLDLLAKRQQLMEENINELRHGEGFIVPLGRAPTVR